MSTTAATLLDHGVLTADSAMDPGAAADMADGHTLEVVVTVEEACEGQAPTLSLVHAPEASDTVWLDFPEPIRVPLNRTGRTWIHAPRYTRYVGWSISGTLDTSPVVSVSLLAKG